MGVSDYINAAGLFCVLVVEFALVLWWISVKGVNKSQNNSPELLNAFFEGDNSSQY